MHQIKYDKNKNKFQEKLEGEHLNTSRFMDLFATLKEEEPIW